MNRYDSEIKLLDRQLELLRIRWRDSKNPLEKKEFEVRAQQLKDERERYEQAQRENIPVEQVRKKIRTVEDAIARAKQLSTNEPPRD